ncbi:MAG: DnaD domain protein [Clostridia bacterium]|nr:DnaD domain protein [Clostridia bacterium]
MKIETIKNQMFENIEINKLFFTDYLPTLNPQSVKVYMYLLYISSENKDFTVETVAGELHMGKNELEDCLVLLQAAELLQIQSGVVVINDLALNELKKSYTLRTAKNPLQSDFTDEKRKEHVQMMKSVSDRFFGGNMPPSWFNQIELWQEKFGFSSDVIFMLFQHCEMNRSMTKAYVRAVAEEWNRQGIKTGSDLGKYLEDYDEYCKMRSAIAKKLNIRRYFNEYEESIIKKWYFTYGYTMSIVEIALKKSVYRTNATLGTFDAIISDWHRNNLKTVTEIEEYEAERKKQYGAQNASQKAARAPYKSADTIRNNFEQRKYNDDFFDGISKESLLDITEEDGNK